jgi:hypothetical protein
MGRVGLGLLTALLAVEIFFECGNFVLSVGILFQIWKMLI